MDQKFHVIKDGYIAMEHANKSDGLGPLLDLQTYSTLEDAIAAVRFKGVQGAPGEVDYFQQRYDSDGKFSEVRVRVYGIQWSDEKMSNVYTTRNGDRMRELLMDMYGESFSAPKIHDGE